jgi:hypothetical protein
MRKNWKEGQKPQSSLGEAYANKAKRRKRHFSFQMRIPFLCDCDSLSSYSLMLNTCTVLLSLLLTTIISDFLLNLIVLILAG